MQWNYRDIMERGSVELKEIVFIITNGEKSKKESDKNEGISKENRKS